MKILHAHTRDQSQATVQPDQSRETITRLSGRWLVLACILWVVLVALGLVVYVASLPVYLIHLQTPCLGGTCIPGQLTTGGVEVLQNLGLPLDLYAVSMVTFNIAALILWFVVGTVLFWRKTDNWMALLVSLSLILVGAAIPPDKSASVWLWPTRFVDFLASVLLFLIFGLFPNGRFVPRWICWLPIVYLALNVLDLFPNLFGKLVNQLLPLYFPLLFGCIGMLWIAQIYRYRRMASLVERQQVKWIVFSCAMIVLGEFVFWVLTLIFPPLGKINSLSDLFFSPITILLTLFIPLSFGFAILRYRLWDVDVLINRTLVYGTLTGTLALLYASLVISLQYLLQGFTGENQLSIIGSTLTIAVLFQPLRRYIQRAIDRRFYRPKYDAAQTLINFSARLRLREDVDLTTLTNDLLVVVQETMQPTHVSLWLLPDEQHWKHHTAFQHEEFLDEKAG